MNSHLRFYTAKLNPITIHFIKFYLTVRCRNLESFVFVATTGRRGTASLARIALYISDCSSHHEPYPIMNKEILALKNSGSAHLVKIAYKYLKSTYIRRAAIGAKYYFETNHMFIKSFIDYAADDFSGKLKIVHLYRDPVAVANSILSLGYIPGTLQGNDWWLDYRWPRNTIIISEELDSDRQCKNDFYKCLWYWYEIEARIKFWKHKLSNVPFFDLRTEDLNSGEKLCALFDKLKLVYNRDQILTAAKTKMNIKSQNKLCPPIPQNEAEKMHKRFVDLLRAKGYSH